MAMETFDVIIAGGGPGGSAAGTFLARSGLKTLLLEKDQHPRFHIGESLLPHGNDLLREMGVWDKIVASGNFLPKPGAEFWVADGSDSTQFEFARQLGPKYASSFQVERAKFDELLFHHAAETGCTVRQHCAVTRIDPQPDHVVVEYSNGKATQRVRAGWLVDASGRDAIAGRLLRVPKLPTQRSVRLATHAHFRGVVRNCAATAGNITIARLREGWFWFIPLQGDMTSVGFVQRAAEFRAAGLSPEASFAGAVARNAYLAERMRFAEREGAFRTEGDYSYCFGSFAPHPRILLAGDAAGFVDPIFSSGVMLALKSGRAAADWIARQPDRGLSPGAQKKYTREIKRMMDLYLRIIDTFYDKAGFELLMNPQPILKIPGAVAAVVGGNTDLAFRHRWRLEAFYFLAWLQRWLPVAPRIPLLAPGPQTQSSPP